MSGLKRFPSPDVSVKAALLFWDRSFGVGGPRKEKGRTGNQYFSARSSSSSGERSIAGSVKAKQEPWPGWLYSPTSEDRLQLTRRWVRGAGATLISLAPTTFSWVGISNRGRPGI